MGLVAVVLRNHQNSQKDKWSYLLALQKLLGYTLARNFDMLLDHTMISSCFKLDMTIISAQVMSLEPNYSKVHPIYHHQLDPPAQWTSFWHYANSNLTEVQ